ncbi:hypothetical protein D9757_004838 [Collybiopsis confluens]|uniref:Uncharacterized protein n=1 Tax=Collybiopsis confluens TaxID=2823264 RepID=A0A8H5HS79_9AGAR|nr:hypothetical protein D9757_004838 [Collybiopsis confluens]
MSSVISLFSAVFLFVSSALAAPQLVRRTGDHLFTLVNNCPESVAPIFADTKCGYSPRCTDASSYIAAQPAIIAAGASRAVTVPASWVGRVFAQIDTCGELGEDCTMAEFNLDTGNEYTPQAYDISNIQGYTQSISVSAAGCDTVTCTDANCGCANAYPEGDMSGCVNDSPVRACTAGKEHWVYDYILSIVPLSVYTRKHTLRFCTHSMATVNISDVDSVQAAYESVLNQECNWILLRYGVENTDDLFLYASGSKGLAELKQGFEDLSVVHIAFYHEEFTQPRPGFALINYIPSFISGVRRGTFLTRNSGPSIHSPGAQLGLLFNHGVLELYSSRQTEYATLTIDDLANLTPFAIHQAVLKPEAVHNIQTPNFPSSPPPTLTSFDPSAQPMIFPINRSITEPPISPPITPQKSQNLISTILRRNRAKTDAPWDTGEAPPPPTPPKVPPKDTTSPPKQTVTDTIRPRAFTLSSAERRDSFADFAFISHSIQLSSASDENDGVLVEHPTLPTSRFSKPDGALFSIPVGPKWSQQTSYIPDPEERARRRQLAQEQRAAEEERARIQELERQERIKREKDQLKRQEEEEEAWRKAALEEELREISAQRKEKERRDREEEEQMKQEIEMRKEADRQRRVREHEKSEKWRQQLAREAEAGKKKEAETRKRMDAVRKIKLGEMVKEVKKEVRSTGSASAWATIQSCENLVWRRRYIKLVGSKIVLYRSPKPISIAVRQDMNQILEEVELRGTIAGLREPNEGFEELGAIPHSFAIEFKDGREPWSMFGDTEEEKIKMLGMLQYAAGL